MTKFAYQYDYQISSLDDDYHNKTYLQEYQYENDVYKFNIHGTKDFHLSLNNISHGDNADLYLYKDSNHNGVLDHHDLQVASSRNSGNADELLSYQASDGKYFAHVEYYSSNDGYINYEFDITANHANNNIKIEAEDYDSYYDKSHGNNGRVYRYDDVDIEYSNDYDGGYSIGWIEKGEYLNYNVNIPHSGYYEVVGRVASDLDQHHSIGVSANNGHETNISFGNTGGWYSWQDAYGGEIYLNEGHNTLTLGMNGSGFNVNYIELVA